MSLLSGKTKEDKAGPIDPAPVFLDARSEFAARFLAGEGLEIGALHQPLAGPLSGAACDVDGHVGLECDGPQLSWRPR